MDKNKIINLFEQAISNSELLDFAFGKNEYFIPDREYGGHWILASWNNFILPLFESKGPDYVNEYIRKMFDEIICVNEIDYPDKFENLLYHLHVYYYLMSENKIHSDAIRKLNSRINESLNVYLKNLIDNKSEITSAVQNAIGLIKSRGGLNENN